MGSGHAESVWARQWRSSGYVIGIGSKGLAHFVRRRRGVDSGKFIQSSEATNQVAVYIKHDLVYSPHVPNCSTHVLVLIRVRSLALFVFYVAWVWWRLKLLSPSVDGMERERRRPGEVGRTSTLHPMFEGGAQQLLSFEETKNAFHQHKPCFCCLYGFQRECGGNHTIVFAFVGNACPLTTIGVKEGREGRVCG